jgi:hypothetical protein
MLLTDSKNPLSSILLRSKLSDARVRAFFSGFRSTGEDPADCRRSFLGSLLGRREDRGGAKRQAGTVSQTIAELHLFTGGKLFVVVKPHQMRPYSVTKL